MELVDIGANLTHADFNEDRNLVLSRAINNGVTKIVLTGTSLRSSREALALAQTKPGILYSTAGVHPHDAKHCNEKTLDELREISQHPQVVAVGECGLDYNRDFSPRPVQDRWFEAQVKLACEIKKPLFLHERDSSQRFTEILQHHQSSLPPTVVHCFTGDEATLDQYLEMGFYIGITGWICDERRGTHLLSLVRKIPLNRLMIETDAPFLLPRNMSTRNQRRNEPAFLVYVVKKIAESLKKTPSEIAQATTETAKQFFQLS